MPQPRISTQPVVLHTRQGSPLMWPLPPHMQQLMSTSAEGSVKGKKLGRKRTSVWPPNTERTKAVRVPRRWAMLMFWPTTRPST